MADPHKRLPWSITDVRAILDGSTDPKAAKATDRKGLTPIDFATLSSATTAERLTELLALLDPPPPEEQSKMDAILDLLERVANGQLRLERQMAAIESRLAAPSGR